MIEETKQDLAYTITAAFDDLRSMIKKKMRATTVYKKNPHRQQAYKMAIAASQSTTIYEDHPYPTISNPMTDAAKQSSTTAACPSRNTKKTKHRPRRAQMTQRNNSYKAFVALQANAQSNPTAPTAAKKSHLFMQNTVRRVL